MSMRNPFARMPPALQLDSPVPQDEARQLDHITVVLVQPVEGHRRNVTRGEAKQGHVPERRVHPAEALAGVCVLNVYGAKHSGRRLHEAVSEDVVGEFVVANFHREGDVETGDGSAPQTMIRPRTVWSASSSVR